MGVTRTKRRKPPEFKWQTDNTNRSLFATAAIVAIVALCACWFGAREVTNGIVNYEARKSARDWAVALSHSISQANAELPASPLRPYSKATSPERFKALDNAMFDGELVSYRLYSASGVVVASSRFEEIGETVDDTIITKVINHGHSSTYTTNSDEARSSLGHVWTATALAPLSRGPDTIGAFEVTVDVSDRAEQLYRLRLIAFGALAAFLASIFGILGISLSRTLRKQKEAQKALAHSEHQHRQLLDDAPDSMIIHNLDEVLYVNAAAVMLHGAGSRDALIGLDPIELVPPEKRDAVAKRRQEAISRGEINSTTLVGRRRLDGTVVETDTMGIPIEWDGQSCILIQSRDVTEQRSAQREIAEREAQLTAFMKNTRSLMFIKSLDGRMTMVNRQFEEFYNLAAADIIHGDAFNRAHKNLVGLYKIEDEQVISSGVAQSAERSVLRSDGQHRMMRYEKFPIKDTLGQVVSIGCISTDITDIQEREEQGRRSQAAAERAQAQLSAFLDNSPSGMYLKDRNRNIVMVNRAFENFYNVTSDDIIGKPVGDWRPGSLTDDVDTLEMEVLRLGETMDMEARIPNAEGKERDIVLSKFPIFTPGGDIVGIGGVNTDVTEIRQQESEVRETQARLAAYIDHIPMMVILLDRDSRFLMINSRYAAFFGVSVEDLVGKIGHDRLSPEHSEMFLTENRQVCDRQETINRVIEFQNADGEARLLQQTKFPIVAGDGAPVAVGIVLHDITDQKRHERDLEKARDAAESANRAKTAFLANMSHEIRTPMNGVFGMADLLAQSELTSDQHRYLNIIRRSGEALLGVINNVLDISRVEAGEFKLDVNTFNLHNVVAEATELFTESASTKGVFIAHNIARNVPLWVEGDAVRLRQVLINLVGNAIKFTDHGSVVIRAVRVGGDGENALIRFEVTDTGIGIERGKLINLFAPFQQADTSITRRFGGSGLGLSIAGHIVGLMQGRIDVDSEPGKGSSFVFSIPMAIDKSKTSPRESEREVLAGKRLLIVDDNPVNLEILSDFARDWNTHFVATANAIDAQAAIRDSIAAHTPFDAALIDIVMPEMDGIALAEWICGQSGGERMKLIGLTSFNWQQDDTESRAAGFCKFVTKPIRRSDLTRLIVEALTNHETIENVAPRNDGKRDSIAITPAGSAKVLLAEDNQVNQELAHAYLIRTGCSVTIAENGRKAVDTFAATAFDIVLMDVQMPEMDGIEATRLIRELEARNGSERTPVIAATAHAFQEDREQCILAGMDDFLSKPYTRKDIEQILGRWLPPHPDSAEEPGNTASDAADKNEDVQEDILDSGTIAQLRSLGNSGEDRIFRKVAAIFIETTPPQLQQLQKHVAAGAFAGIMLIAHSLKTSSANVAALSLSDQFRALELAARSEDADACGLHTKKISETYEDVATALQRAAGIDVSNRRTG